MSDETHIHSIEPRPDELRILKRALTVAELREALADHPDDALCLLVCPYGDMGNTQQAIPITSVEAMYEDQQKIVSTAYSQSRLAVELTQEDEEYAGPDIILIQ